MMFVFILDVYFYYVSLAFLNYYYLTIINAGSASHIKMILRPKLTIYNRMQKLENCILTRRWNCLVWIDFISLCLSPPVGGLQ